MRYISLVLLLVWVHIGTSNIEKPVVVDTNVCVSLLQLFGAIQEERTGMSLDRPAYTTIWELFNNNPTSTVSNILKDFVPNLKLDKYDKGIMTVERILLLKGVPDSGLDIPEFVYNEFAGGQSSKTTSIIKKGVDREKVIFLDAFKTVITTNINKRELSEEGVDFPVKAQKGKETKIEMREFIERNRDRNKQLGDLLSHLKEASNEDGMKKRLTKLKNLNKDVHDKGLLWDKSMKEIISSHKSMTSALDALYPSIKDYPDIRLNPTEEGVIDSMVERLLIKKEEFDFYDLQIFLYAKEKNAYILSFNTQAFQEVNDPRFLEYFKDLKILHPEVNFRDENDLERNFDYVKLTETTVKNDFEKDAKLLTSNNEYHTHEAIKTVINKILVKHRDAPGNLNSIIEEFSLPQALKIMDLSANPVKIFKKKAFAGTATNLKKESLRLLRFIDKEFFSSKLSHNDFTITEPEQSNKDLKLDPKAAEYLEEGRSRTETLEEFISIFRGNEDAKIYTNIYALSIENDFVEEIIQNKIKTLKTANNKLRPQACPRPAGSRRRRETGRCLLSWDMIDNIIEGRSRDVNNIHIESDKFLSYVETIKNPEVRKQLLQFTEQILDTSKEYSGRLTGQSELEVKRLLNRNKVADHFTKMGQISGALNNGIFAKDLFADLLNGNTGAFAVNVGVFGGSMGLHKIALAAESRGGELAVSGKKLLGSGLKAASPFIQRLSSGLVVYDLINQIDELKKGNQDALINIIGDSIMLTADSIEITVALLEGAGLVAGISGPLAPIVMAVGATVVIGTEVYFAVKHVKALDQVLHLTTDEKIIEALNDIFHSPSGYLAELKEIKSANNHIARKAMDFLNQHETYGFYFAPSTVLNMQTGEAVLSERVTILPDITANIIWDRTRPDDPLGGRVFCAQQGYTDNSDSEMPSLNVTHRCLTAIGIMTLANRAQQNALFNLNHAYSEVIGFSDHSNTFLFGNGFKDLTGGEKNDIFSLKGNVWETTAKIVGLGGDNTIDISGVTNQELLTFDWEREILGEYTQFKNINMFIGRKGYKEIVKPVCSTKYINAQGGENLRSDQIVIENRRGCRYNLTVQLNSNTVVRNLALLGDFTYNIDRNQNTISVLADLPLISDNFARKADKRLINTTHTFLINYDLLDLTEVLIIQSIKENPLKVAFHFYDSDTNNTLVNHFNLNTRRAVFILKDHTEIRSSTGGLYVTHKTDKKIMEFVGSYWPLAIKLNVIIAAYSVESEQQIILNGNDQKNILSNNPDHHTTIYTKGFHLGNVFIMNYKKYVQVEIVNPTEPTSVNTLDLRSISQQFKSNPTHYLILYHSIIPVQNTLVIDLLAVERFSDSPSTYGVMRIWIGNSSNHCDNIHIILNNAPVILKCDQQHDLGPNYNNPLGDILTYEASQYYTPLPITFNKTETIVLTVYDIETHMEVVVEQPLGSYDLLRFDNDLVLTNTLIKANSTTFIEDPCSVLLKDIYSYSDIFYTLTITFHDQRISLNEKIDSILNAKDFYDESTII